MHPFIDLCHRPSTNAGILDGSRFAVKDIYAVAGEVAGFGNPTWKQTHAPAVDTSPVIQSLLNAGAELIAKTHTDEMTYSLAGINFHYGAVENPKAPGRTAGGSSSGSASAVAANLVDFALGSDTGGSIRVPASYCGLYGIRPTHNRVSLEGVCPLAASFDTCGWFTRNADWLQRVGDVLLPKKTAPMRFRSLWVPQDVLDRLRSDVHPLVHEFSCNLAKRWNLEILQDPLVEPGDDLLHWAEIFRIHQAREAWQAHGEWIRHWQPTLGPDIAERFQMASQITQSAFEETRLMRAQRRKMLLNALSDDILLLLPAAPDIAPSLQATAEEIQEFRSRTLQITSIAGLCGLPQVVFPWLQRQGAPLGLSLAGPPDADRDLLALIS